MKKTNNLTFDKALKAICKGQTVSRLSWNGLGLRYDRGNPGFPAGLYRDTTEGCMCMYWPNEKDMSAADWLVVQ